MIKTDKEYRSMLEQLETEDRQLDQQRRILGDAGLNEDQLEAAMEPLVSFRDQLREEVEFYERIMRKDFGALSSFESIGRLLIALRISSNLTQHDLAVRLQVSDSQVSRDERDEYFGATVQKVKTVLQALGYRLHSTVEPLEQKASA